MPTYEFRCPACGHRWSAVETIAEHETARHRCPRCGAAGETVPAPFFAKTVRKS